MSGQYPGIDRFPGFGREEKVTSPIAMERTKQALTLHHIAQCRQHRAGRFLLHQLGIVDLVGGIVENHQQVISAVIETDHNVTRSISSFHAWPARIFR